MIQITPEIAIDESEIKEEFIRSSGPGGQNVNKVATAVQLRFNLNAASLPEDVMERLKRIARNRINAEGVLIIEARQYRTQEQNRHDALERLVNLIRQATEKPKARKKTRPTLASKQRRLSEKKQRGEVKRLRRSDEW
jgi:ribosome-associated protein